MMMPSSSKFKSVDLNISDSGGSSYSASSTKPPLHTTTTAAATLPSMATMSASPPRTAHLSISNDPVGDALTDLLNQHALFLTPYAPYRNPHHCAVPTTALPSSSSTPGPAAATTTSTSTTALVEPLLLLQYPPLLSRHNARALQQHMRLLREAPTWCARCILWVDIVLAHIIVVDVVDDDSNDNNFKNSHCCCSARWMWVLWNSLVHCGSLDRPCKFNGNQLEIASTLQSSTEANTTHTMMSMIQCAGPVALFLLLLSTLLEVTVVVATTQFLYQAAVFVVFGLLLDWNDILSSWNNESRIGQSAAATTTAKTTEQDECTTTFRTGQESSSSASSSASDSDDAVVVSLQSSSWRFAGFLVVLYRCMVCLGRAAVWIDRYVLLGVRYSGREWNQYRSLSLDTLPPWLTTSMLPVPGGGGELQQQEGSNRSGTTTLNPVRASESLLLRWISTKSTTAAEHGDSKHVRPVKSSLSNPLQECSPPSLKRWGRRLGLDADYLLRACSAEWSAATVQHMVGVHFCAVQLRDDRLRYLAERQERISQQQQQQRKRIIVAHSQQNSDSTALAANTTSRVTRTAHGARVNGQGKRRRPGDPDESNSAFSPRSLTGVPRRKSRWGSPVRSRLQEQQRYLLVAATTTTGGSAASTSSPTVLNGEGIELKMISKRGSKSTSKSPTARMLTRRHSVSSTYFGDNWQERSSLPSRRFSVNEVIQDSYMSGDENDDDEEEVVVFANSLSCDDDYEILTKQRIFSNDGAEEYFDDDDDGDLNRPIAYDDEEEYSYNEEDEGEADEIASNSDVMAADLPWIDVGAKIGMRLLNSTHVQRAMVRPDLVTAPAGRFMALPRNGGGGGGTTRNNHPLRRFMPHSRATAHLIAAIADTEGDQGAGNVIDGLSGTDHSGIFGTPTRMAPFSVSSTVPTLQGTPDHSGTLQSENIDLLQTSGPTIAMATAKKPVHSMWTSPGAARHMAHEDPDDGADREIETCSSSGIATSSSWKTSTERSGTAKLGNSNMRSIDHRPPRSPRSRRENLAAQWTLSSARNSWSSTAKSRRSTASCKGTSRSLSPCRRVSQKWRSHQLSPGRKTDPPNLPSESLGFPSDGLDELGPPSLHRLGGPTRSQSDTGAASSPGPLLSFPEFSPRPSASREDWVHLSSKNSFRAAATPIRSTKTPTTPSKSLFVPVPRDPLQAGIKMAVPVIPVSPGLGHGGYRKQGRGFYRPPKTSVFQMATVVRSERIDISADNASILEGDESTVNLGTNALSITVKLDKSFLRNGEFAEMTIRVLDEWPSRHMPCHSKVPIGSCVATAFGIGILVGWRVEDDCHVIRSMWQRRGSGSAHAYLNRDAIYGTTAAAVGFRVDTRFGGGDVLACVDGGRTFLTGRFFVAIRDEGRHKGQVLELNDYDIVSCHGAQFIPIIEHIREAARYQIQVDNYKALLREQQLDSIEDAPTPEQVLWRSWSACLEILWNSFLKAVDEDKDFNEGVNDFTSFVIHFLEHLDKNQADDSVANSKSQDLVDDPEKMDTGKISNTSQNEEPHEPGFWIMNDLFGGIFKGQDGSRDEGKAKRVLPEIRHVHDVSYDERDAVASKEQDTKKKTGRTYYDRAYAGLRTARKTVSIARASSVDYPHFRLALAVCYDFLLFLRTIVKVQEKNRSVQSLAVWKRAWGEIVATFGPIKDRLEKIGLGIAQRMEKQGRKAKIRVLKFVDTIVSDERLLIAMEQGEWDQCLLRLEAALVKAAVIEEENLAYYHKIAKFIYDHLQKAMSSEGRAAARNNEKLALLAQAVKSLASPRRSVLKILLRDDVLELLERIFVRAYYKEEVATRMLTIHASNFHSLRHLRMLKDFSVAGRIWIPLLDAADEEFSWVVGSLPDSSKDFLGPIASLFSLCVAQFHKINAGDLSKDWLAFLLEDESVRLIQDIDMKLILALESFSRDVREMMVVLPYYSSIDDDILQLMDEVDVDVFLKELSEAMDDTDKLSHFVREKATIAIERFLNYLPKMSIPVEKRDLGEGWTLTCRGEDGGDLTLSDVNIKRENLICQIMGGDALFFPLVGDDDGDQLSVCSSVNPFCPVDGRHSKGYVEESVLHHIRELLLHAQRFGCWQSGVGGVGQPPSDHRVASVLQGLPVSAILNCAIELWRNLEIDDDELLELAVRDVSFQIQLQKEREEGRERPEMLSSSEESYDTAIPNHPMTSVINEERQPLQATRSEGSRSSPPNFESIRRRFNPRVDPTVFLLEIKNLKLQLDNFLFRIEKNDKRTIFDPVFEGRGMVSLQNISIRLRIECAKERVRRNGMGVDVSAPILHLRELTVQLQKVHLRVRDTGFGSDWILNRAVQVFGENITRVVEENLREQICEQAKVALENLNAYFVLNPNLLLNLLGISMEDLDESVVWV